MDGTGEHHVMQNKPDSERQTPNIFSHIQNLHLKIFKRQERRRARELGGRG
jgi:hypothetical protein